MMEGSISKPKSSPIPSQTSQLILGWSACQSQLHDHNLDLKVFVYFQPF